MQQPVLLSDLRVDGLRHAGPALFFLGLAVPEPGGALALIRCHLLGLGLQERYASRLGKHRVLGLERPCAYVVL